MDNAGEKLRGSLVDEMGRGGVLRQIAATIERTASHTGSILSLNGSFSKPKKSPSQQKLQSTDAGETSKTQSMVEIDDGQDSRTVSAAGSRRRDNRVALPGPPLGAKHRRNASDGSDGGGEKAPLSVYSKELHRWVAADASQQITVDRKGTPHKRRISKTPTNATPTATISATDSVKRRLKFLHPSPTVSRGQDNPPASPLDRAKTTSDPEHLPRVAFQDQLTNTALGALPSKLDVTAEVHEEESCTGGALSGSTAVLPASGGVDTSGGFDGLALHNLSTGLELQLESSNVSLGATSPQDLPTSMRHDATHSRLEAVENTGNDCEVEREEEANSRRRRRRAQSFVSASRRPRKLSVVGGLDSSAIMGTPTMTATPRATPRPASALENWNGVLAATCRPELAFDEPRSASSGGCSVDGSGTEADPDATWSNRKQLAYLRSQPDLSDFGPDLPTPIPATDSATELVDLDQEKQHVQEPQPEPAQELELEQQPPHPVSVSSSSEDEYDAAPPPRQSPTWPAVGANGTPYSVLKRRKGRSTSLDTAVVVDGGNNNGTVHDILNASALSGGTCFATTN